ncbi:N5-carboxyaminoimidazole ribonucleotide synthase [Weizmannia acidilactici]|uniref:N5-carboxyaminoimidazole ribonucleotide synthase n=1 Tax=Weizmannia acidilactici TaxID=2607726 RepID=A0A5J4JNX9_9BACI|nr:5-(carboxyamino)imidazole ribonucleotide synthase [Weizmannia acidilactici]GER68023.1 N5-carboxyaminoimidazole ribonucleotide synthase [Weizmannia acidilactici]GER70714.1 N5-carboxyaminoimidazole ribonucleotide synthase [Weizmannia acidilactici]GER74207.1 N5-carboxyaminoimidazole ribonucleotide synthase [Weizmannia acidilactici]
MSREMIQPGSTIGIIGGGQLGKMMALAAKEAGFRIIVLDPTPNCPCAQVADDQVIAAYDDEAALRQLGARCDVITYEFENIDYETLKKTAESAHVPQGAELIRVTQNRIYEKDAVTKAGVRVAPYKVVQNEADLKAAVAEIGYPCILKTARGGYDGKGQVTLRDEKSLTETRPLLVHGACVLEKMIDFAKELSVIITRNEAGETSLFPVVENIHHDHILHKTIAPARVDGAVQEEVQQIALQVAESLNLVGTLAVEMFLEADGTIYVNELAPRPHNSGHYSIEACSISQFGQHIRAICNWPLRKVELLKPAVMVNLLGQHLEKAVGQIPYQPEWSVHIYGKKEAKYQRKMGHITVLTDEIEETLLSLEKSGVWQDVQKRSEAAVND